MQRVTYYRPESRYAVLRVRPEKGSGDASASPGELFPLLTAVGHGEEPPPGARVELAGSWETHPTHGRQFAFEWLRVLPPLDEAGLVRYLSSRTFEGVGETLARRIVEKLGTDCLTVIGEEPERLRDVRGLRPAVRERLAARVRDELASHQTQAFLAGLGLGPQLAHAVAKRFGADTEARVAANPYVLATEIQGIGFRTADRVARELGLAADSEERRAAALHQALTDATGEGHSLVRRDALFDGARELLREDVPQAGLEEALARLRMERAVRVDGELEDGDARCYLPALHHCEVELARNVARQLGSGTVPALADEARLAAAERRSRLALHPLQREAVLGLLSRPLGLLTGGPGVGKTTIVRLVVELAQAAGTSVCLASPTGRAAKRLSEATAQPAGTIHRLLGWDQTRGGFAHDADRPLSAGLLVVDEISMLDLTLAHHLFKAVRPPTRVVLVGDPDQLPSVGAGNVLADLLACGHVPTWRLTRVYRQEGESLIVANAHRILSGELPEAPGREAPLQDFYFFPVEGEGPAADRTVEVVTRRIPERFGLRWDEDVQVLAPMYRGACGVDALNVRLREALGAGGREVSFRGQVWREGDRVLHTRNDYEKQVFNGDLGRVVRVGDDGSLTVRYPEQDVVYAPRELADLQAAFAMTVHRSQGGEFPAVVMPLVTQHYVMLQRHLLYTAVTRARRLCVLVGSPRALRTAVDNAEQSRRESALAERLRDLCGAAAP